MSRRNILKAGGVGLVTAGLSGTGAQLFASEPALPDKYFGQIAAGTFPPSPKKANYVLSIENADLNPDGRKVVRGVTANGGIPAPEIRLTEGDMFRAQVENRLETQDTSIHWHGLLLPASMDGVPGVVQDPIRPGQVFIYEYPILQNGTYWYHSHLGLQEQSGLGGPFIVEAKDEPLEYDRDYVLFLGDWVHREPDAVFAELKEGEEMMMMEGPDLSDIDYDAFLINGRGNDDPARFVARPGERVRFRVINGGASTVFRVKVDDLPMTVTHADGPAVQPLEIDHFMIGMGETYDFTVTLRESGSFTIHAEAQDESGQAVAVLHTPDVTPKADLTKPRWGPRGLSYAQLRSTVPVVLPEGPARRYAIELKGNMSRYVWSIDGQVYPDAEPLFVRQGERVEITMTNRTRMWHPMHLHGHFFRPKLPGVEAARRPLKHTINVAPDESLTFEFVADNPGKWFFHCHNLYHLHAGMARELHYQV